MRSVFGIEPGHRYGDFFVQCGDIPGGRQLLFGRTQQAIEFGQHVPLVALARLPGVSGSTCFTLPLGCGRAFGLHLHLDGFACLRAHFEYRVAELAEFFPQCLFFLAWQRQGGRAHVPLFLTILRYLHGVEQRRPGTVARVELGRTLGFGAHSSRFDLINQGLAPRALLAAFGIE